jgi:hypothetical protein
VPQKILYVLNKKKQIMLSAHGSDLGSLQPLGFPNANRDPVAACYNDYNPRSYYCSGKSQSELNSVASKCCSGQKMNTCQREACAKCNDPDRSCQRSTTTNSKPKPNPLPGVNKNTNRSSNSGGICIIL